MIKAVYSKLRTGCRGGAVVVGVLVRIERSCLRDSGIGRKAHVIDNSGILLLLFALTLPGKVLYSLVSLIS